MALVKTGDWSWEQYPRPYDFLFQGVRAPMPAPVLPRRGLGGLGCAGCPCAGAAVAAVRNASNGGAGLGCVGNPKCPCLSGAPLGSASGLGLFDSGLDVTQWGLGEYAALGLGIYLAASVFGDVSSGARKVRKSIAARQQRSRRRAELRKELAEL